MTVIGLIQMGVTKLVDSVCAKNDGMVSDVIVCVNVATGERSALIFVIVKTTLLVILLQGSVYVREDGLAKTVIKFANLDTMVTIVLSCVPCV